ncbi:signal recognition particle-docking protein FtsY [Sporanaerobium hydrogeniformans]|uniref:signal recognition particle-docking protein FtsY n=1 Tax=Sporanaerobium hydrogeniformans TaxID=3072179 RepID=UPI002FE50B3D
MGAPKQGFIKKLFSGLTKTRDTLLKGVDEVLGAFKQIDEDLYEELEEALIMADFGVDTTLHIMEELRSYVKAHKISEPSALKEALQTIITEMIMAQPEDLMVQEGPTVVLVIGVNGAGKTTSIGKLAHLLKQNDKKVLLAAADTFRAAAINQLQVWADRAGVDLIKHEEGSDAAAVVFDAIAAAKSRKVDVLICDTAGRLQNKVNLMKELEKISRIIEKEYPEAKKEILIVLDATTGQNALQQVKLFKEVANINGIILTKLDGTAKGGAIVGIYSTFQVPVKYIGVGEKIDDLQPFDSEAFAKALFKNN